MTRPVTIRYVAGEMSVTFFVGINAKKTLKDFQEHEKHLGLTQDQLKEAYEQIKKAAAGDVPASAPATASAETK